MLKTFKAVTSWFRSWYTTLEIKFRHPELYTDLCCALDDPFGDSE